MSFTIHCDNLHLIGFDVIPVIQSFTYEKKELDEIKIRFSTATIRMVLNFRDYVFFPSPIVILL